MAPDPAALAEYDKRACDVILELVKQILTLSTALIAAAIAAAQLLKPNAFPHPPFTSGLVCFAASILFGLLCLMSIVSTYANGSTDVARNVFVRSTAVVHVGAFFIGVICLLWTAFKIIA